MTTQPMPLSDLVTGIATGRNGSDKALIISFYGDAILPHGGAIWLGSIVSMLGKLGVAERGVRTAAFRLVREGWLSSRQVGRRSYYALTEQAHNRFDAAHRTIYATGPAQWDGTWTMVFSGLATPEARERLLPDLVWQGFGQLLPGVMVHPAPDGAALRATLKGHPDVPVMRANGEGWMAGEQVKHTIQRAWNLDRLAADYAAFVARFAPALSALEAAPDAQETCFRLRILLIHEYRRVLLRDPLLPTELLPLDWPGTAARQLCQTLYRRIHAAADAYLQASIETDAGALPAADARYFARFGGL